MELIHAAYRVSNGGGSNIVSGDEARKVWESWDPDHRGGSLEAGFLVWDVRSDGSGVLMSTSYIPVARATT